MKVHIDNMSDSCAFYERKIAICIQIGPKETRDLITVNGKSSALVTSVLLLKFYIVSAS